MNTIGIKKKRCINWDEREKALLRQLVTKYIHIIENKSQTGTSFMVKTKTWNIIHRKFISVHRRNNRSVKELRTQWKNMKNIAKAEKNGSNTSIEKPHVIIEDDDLVKMSLKMLDEEENADIQHSDEDPMSPDPLYDVEFASDDNAERSQTQDVSLPAETEYNNANENNSNTDNVAGSETNDDIKSLTIQALESEIIQEQIRHDQYIKHKEELHAANLRAKELECQFWERKLTLLEEFYKAKMESLKMRQSE